MANRDASGRFVGRKFELVTRKWQGEYRETVKPIEVLAYLPDHVAVLENGEISRRSYGTTYDAVDSSWKFIREVKA